VSLVTKAASRPGGPGGCDSLPVRRAYWTTTTRPFMPACSVHVYGKLPGAGNVREADPVLISPMSPPGGAPPDPNRTLCCDANDQVTVPPAVIVTQAGEKVFDVVAFTSALDAAPAAVTVTATPVELIEPELAVTVDDPTPTPVPVV
jgi:hypothetical protein